MMTDPPGPLREIEKTKVGVSQLKVLSLALSIGLLQYSYSIKLL